VGNVTRALTKLLKTVSRVTGAASTERFSLQTLSSAEKRVVNVSARKKTRSEIAKLVGGAV
jgi:hypothetical protein